jgi:hypothetical protein
VHKKLDDSNPINLPRISYLLYSACDQAILSPDDFSPSKINRERADQMTLELDRRKILQGTSAAALSAMVPSFASAAPKRMAMMAPSSMFNGGRSQVNLNFLQIGGDFPFINCLKNGQGWGFLDNSGVPTPDSLDSNGYPLTLSHGGVNTVFFVPSQAERPGQYVITWSGNGTIFVGMNNTLVSGSTTSTNGSGRYVFSTTDSRFIIGISALGTPRITNMQVFHANDEAALNSGAIFCQQFVTRLKQGNFGVIRFLNWQSGNTTNVTTWATRKPISYAFYSATEMRPSLYAGVTTNAGSAYSVSFPNFALVDKATVTVNFNASSTGSATLNVNGTGNVNILSEYATALASGGNSYIVGGNSFYSIATLVYDATLNAWIKQGGDAAMLSTGLTNGCPPELMVQLCTLVGAHPYFVTPPLAIDPATDYMPSLAAYCRATGPAWMIPRFEGPNELWNTGGGFYQTYYAMAKATAYGWGNDYNNWYGKVMSVLGQAVSSAYGHDRTKYQVICGVQTGYGNNSFGTAACNARLASTQYLTQSNPPQAPYTKTPASQWVTHVCCAQYYVPSEYGTAQETADAAAFAAAAGNPTLQASIATAYANTSNSGTGYNLPVVASWYANWKAWALTFGVTKMCGYEGGYSPDFSSYGTSQVDQLRAASKLSPVLYNFTMVNYNNFVGLTDSVFTAEFPSCFQLSGSLPVSNVWSVLDDIYQSPNPPQWNAIVAFNN